MKVPMVAEVRAVTSETFSRDTFNPVTYYSVSHFAADSDAESAAFLLALLKENDKVFVAELSGICRQMNKLRSFKQPIGLRKA